jgi:hypothetical protein
MDQCLGDKFCKKHYSDIGEIGACVFA